MNKLQQLQARFAELKDKIGAIRALESPSAEQVTELRAHVTEAQGVQTEIEGLRELGASLDALDTFDTAPVESRNIFGRTNGRPQEQRADEPQVDWNDTESMTLITGRTADGRPIARYANPSAMGIGEGLQRTISEPTYRDAFLRFAAGVGDSADRRTLEGPAAQFRVLNSGQEGDGAALLPTVIQARVLQRLADPNNTLGYFTQVGALGSEVVYPIFRGGDDTASSALALQWLGETGSVANDTSLENWGEKQINVHRYGLEVRASRTWLEDANDPVTWMAGKIADCARLGLMSVTTTGDGVGKPRGYMSGVGDSNRLESVNINDAIDGDGLLAIIGELPEQYDSERAIFITKRVTAFQNLYTIKDSNGAYIGGLAQINDGGIATRRQAQIFGYRNVFNPYMAAYAADAHPLAFGDFSGYVFANRKVMTMELLTDATLQRKDIRAWYIRGRCGGDVAEDWMMKAGKVHDR